MAMNKTLFLFFFFFCLLVVTVPMAKAQLGGIGGLLGLIRIQGTVFCSLNGNVTSLTNVTSSTPVFPNAQVQLQCGPENIVVSTTSTNLSGAFSMILDPLQFLLSTLVSDCRLSVTTPLSVCNATLPSVGGLLSSPLKLVGNTVTGLLSIINLAPLGFGLN
ncbi:PREDICTED: phylloplanin [Tarenaya hassleriana]|uniref:phylloplanin n=1 Tax=Tarenaya hassleriana TaxID=28532 RepID=UPI00053C5A6B|nr:PREDICTED: phylloplanin [Tarenaya hassleriana]